jgi:hypothetical protein
MIDANKGLYTANSKLALFLAHTQMTSLIQNSQQHQLLTHKDPNASILYLDHLALNNT